MSISDLGREYDEDIKAATRLLPAWFTERMMTDQWSFGLLLVTGQVLNITSIHSLHKAADGTLWIDANMEIGELCSFDEGQTQLWSPTSRTTVSINAAHVVAAFETADTCHAP